MLPSSSPSLNSRKKTMEYFDWTRGQTIGRGSSATVSIATCNQSAEPFAVKSAELSQLESSGLLMKEQTILSALTCPQIIAYKGCDVTYEDGKLFYNLFLEYAPGGTLGDVIRKLGGRLDEDIIRSYTRAILLGLDYLHSNRIVHCDIKGHNILVSEDGMLAKIADFGCARRVDDIDIAEEVATAPAPDQRRRPQKIAGTPLYMAPEVARGEEQGFPADVWALGCTVVEMATGRAPWADVVCDPVSALYQIGFSGTVPDVPSLISEEGKDFLSKCLTLDPIERWTASELLNHAFVAGGRQKFLCGAEVDSPTSALDWVEGSSFWASSSVSSSEVESPYKSSRDNHYDSPLERIQQLAHGNSKQLAMPKWTCAWDYDDTTTAWVTVRNNVVLRSTKIQGSVIRQGKLNYNHCNLEHPNHTKVDDRTQLVQIQVAAMHDNLLFSGGNRCNSNSNGNCCATYGCIRHGLSMTLLFSIAFNCPIDASFTILLQSRIHSLSLPIYLMVIKKIFYHRVDV